MPRYDPKRQGLITDGNPSPGVVAPLLTDGNPLRGGGGGTDSIFGHDIPNLPLVDDASSQLRGGGVVPGGVAPGGVAPSNYSLEMGAIPTSGAPAVDAAPPVRGFDTSRLTRRGGNSLTERGRQAFGVRGPGRFVGFRWVDDPPPRLELPVTEWGGGSLPAFDWGSLFGGGGGGGGGGGIHAGHVTAGHATAALAEASLIDMNDPIYSLFAPKPWLSGMLAKGKEFLSASTEDNLRLMRDNATRAGVSTSSPAFMYMQSMQRRDQEKALANALRDANLAWTLPAADRRAGALGQNANMLTSTANANADRRTNVSIANAGYQTQASAANASNQLAASQANAANRLGYAQLGQQRWMFQTDFIRNMMRDQQQLALEVLRMEGGGGGDIDYEGPGWDTYAHEGLAGGGRGLDAYRQLRDWFDRNRSRGDNGRRGSSGPGYVTGGPAPVEI